LPGTARSPIAREAAGTPFFTIVCAASRNFSIRIGDSVSTSATLSKP
jgi:hypothetical protein